MYPLTPNHKFQAVSEAFLILQSCKLPQPKFKHHNCLFVILLTHGYYLPSVISVFLFQFIQMPTDSLRFQYLWFRISGLNDVFGSVYGWKTPLKLKRWIRFSFFSTTAWPFKYGGMVFCITLLKHFVMKCLTVLTLKTLLDISDDFPWTR